MMGRSSDPSLDLGSFAGVPLFSPHLVLNAAQLATHKWVMGLTGRGKSKHLASHFLQLFKQGIGVAVIDPHANSRPISLPRCLMRAGSPGRVCSTRSGTLT